MTDEEKLAEEYRKELKERLLRDDDFERLEMFDENVEEAYLAGRKSNSDVIAELEKENAELKTKLLQERETYWSKGFEYSKDKLTKAKKIIKRFSEFANNEIEYDPEHPQEHTDLWNKLGEEVEQFLKEVEE